MGRVQMLISKDHAGRCIFAVFSLPDRGGASLPLAGFSFCEQPAQNLLTPAEDALELPHSVHQNNGSQQELAHHTIIAMGMKLPDGVHHGSKDCPTSKAALHTLRVTWVVTFANAS